MTLYMFVYTNSGVAHCVAMRQKLSKHIFSCNTIEYMYGYKYEYDNGYVYS